MTTQTIIIRFEGQGGDQIEKMFGRVEDSGNKLGGALGRVGEIASGFLAANVVQNAVGAVTDFIGGSVEAASSLGESINAVNVTFGEAAGTIHSFAETAAEEVGLSTRAFNELSTPLGAILKNAKIPLEDTADLTVNLTKRASDMASVFNTDVTTALEAIQSGLRGEANPLERFGVGLNAAAVEARALADTGKDNAKALTEQEKALARVNIIMEQTANLEGDFKNTSDGLANSQRIQAAQTEELQAKIGTKLIPVMLLWNKVKFEAINLLVSGLIPALNFLSNVIGTHVVPVLQNFSKYIQFVISDGDTMNDFLANMPGPLQGIAQAIGEVVLWIQTKFIPAMQDLVGFIQQHWPEIQAVISFAIDFVITKIEGFIQAIGAIIEIVTSVVNLVTALFRGDWSAAWSEMKDIASASIDLLLGLIKAQFGNIPGIILDLAGQAASAAGQFAEGIYNAIVRFLEQLPGRMAQIGRDAANSFLNNISVAGVSVGDIKGVIGKLPGFAAGSPFIPQDMVAYVHRGEAIIPANMNPFGPGDNKAGGGIVVNIDTVNARNEAEARDSAYILSWALQRGVESHGVS